MIYKVKTIYEQYITYFHCKKEIRSFHSCKCKNHRHCYITDLCSQLNSFAYNPVHMFQDRKLWNTLLHTWFFPFFILFVVLISYWNCMQINLRLSFLYLFLWFFLCHFVIKCNKLTINNVLLLLQKKSKYPEAHPLSQCPLVELQGTLLKQFSLQ